VGLSISVYVHVLEKMWNKLRKTGMLSSASGHNHIQDEKIMLTSQLRLKHVQPQKPSYTLRKKGFYI